MDYPQDRQAVLRQSWRFSWRKQTKFLLAACRWRYKILTSQYLPEEGFATGKGAGMRTAKPARRERILTTAARLFGEHPYHEVRIEDIAARAGVSKGAVYLYFKDKEDLYMELILYSLQRLYEEARQTVATLPVPEEQLHALVATAVRFFSRAPHFLELIQRADISGSAAYTAALQNSRRQFLQLLMGVLQDLHASGRYRVEDPELAALALMGMTREILRWYGKGTADLAERIVRLFLRGLSSQAAPG
jgi:AcrR family transcriptional regulator